MDTTSMYSKNSKNLIFMDYYLTFQTKQTQREVINMLLYQIFAYAIHENI